MEIVSDKILYEEDAKKIIGNTDLKCIWAYELCEYRICVYKQKSNLIQKKKEEIEEVILIYIDEKKDEFIRQVRVHSDEINKILYINEKSFAKRWKEIKKSVKRGLLIKKDEKTKPDDLVDFLNKNGGYLNKKGENIKEKKEAQRFMSKKMSAIDNFSNKYFYSIKDKIYHDKDCELVKHINPKDFMASIKKPAGYVMCGRCRRNFTLKEGCSPYRKRIPEINYIFIKNNIDDARLEKYVFSEGLRFNMENKDELIVKSKEDTFIIKGLTDSNLSLWHNNYVKINRKERLIISGFHNQGYDGRKLKDMLYYASNYSYKKHLKMEAGKQGIVYVFRKVFAYFKNLIRKIFK